MLLDLQLGDADGFDLLPELRAQYPALPVVVVSASDRASDVIRAIDLGAMGFVPKRAQQRHAVRGAAHGDVGRHLRAADDARRDAGTAEPPDGDTVPGSHAPRARGAAADGGLPDAAPPLRLRSASRRARPTCWRCCCKGKPNKLIARELGLSVETVKDHVAAVLRALGVSSRTQAVLAVSQMSQASPGWRRGARRAALSAPGAAATAAVVTMSRRAAASAAPAAR